MRLLGKLALGLTNLFKEICFREERPYLAFLDVGNQVGEYRLVPGGATDQGQIFEIKAVYLCQSFYLASE